jgi:hypothetical protein
MGRLVAPEEALRNVCLYRIGDGGVSAANAQLVFRAVLERHASGPLMLSGFQTCLRMNWFSSGTAKE